MMFYALYWGDVIHCYYLHSIFFWCLTLRFARGQWGQQKAGDDHCIVMDGNHGIVEKRNDKNLMESWLFCFPGFKRYTMIQTCSPFIFSFCWDLNILRNFSNFTLFVFVERLAEPPGNSWKRLLERSNVSQVVRQAFWIVFPEFHRTKVGSVSTPKRSASLTGNSAAPCGDLWVEVFGNSWSPQMVKLGK